MQVVCCLVDISMCSTALSNSECLKLNFSLLPTKLCLLIFSPSYIKAQPPLQFLKREIQAFSYDVSIAVDLSLPSRMRSPGLISPKWGLTFPLWVIVQPLWLLSTTAMAILELYTSTSSNLTFPYEWMVET